MSHANLPGHVSCILLYTFLSLSSETIRTEAQVRVRGRVQGGDAGGACAQDHPRSRRHDLQEVQARQAGVPGSAQVRPSRGVQADGEYAHAVGSRPQCSGKEECGDDDRAEEAFLLVLRMGHSRQTLRTSIVMSDSVSQYHVSSGCLALRRVTWW